MKVIHLQKQQIKSNFSKQNNIIMETIVIMLLPCSAWRQTIRFENVLRKLFENCNQFKILPYCESAYKNGTK